METPQCFVDTCVGDETVNSSGDSAVRNMILFSAWCTSLRVCHLVISGSLVYSMLTHVLRVVCWTDQLSFFTSPVLLR